MHLSAIGKFAQDQIHHMAAIRDGDVSIPQYTVMPNHIHMIIVIRRRRDALNASLEPNAERTRNGHTNNGRIQKWTHAVRPYDDIPATATVRTAIGEFCRQKNGGARWWHPPIKTLFSWEKHVKHFYNRVNIKTPLYLCLQRMVSIN